ncbi:MAG: GNAT family N-acetyltransferase [Eubacteriales bacterium]|nr:GNAT family N-acetyltransferase [Eubacteriales bacterium]
MNLQLRKLDKTRENTFIRDMQYAFQVGAESEGDHFEEALPEDHVREALEKEQSIAYMVMKDDDMVGGVILDFDPDPSIGYLEFIYVKVGMEGKGLGKEIWRIIELKHPEIKKWETFTPYSWKRNIHFYINVCGFQVVEFFNDHHTENDPEHEGEEYFRFEKYIRN